MATETDCPWPAPEGKDRLRPLDERMSEWMWDCQQEWSWRPRPTPEEWKARHQAPPPSPPSPEETL